jgi:hypothetical protein
LVEIAGAIEIAGLVVFDRGVEGRGRDHRLSSGG